MKLRTYRAWTMAEALATVKQDLGADAVILHTRTFERGGFLGFGRKSVCEITAARAADFQRENVDLSGAPTRRAESAPAAMPTAQRRSHRPHTVPAQTSLAVPHPPQT